MQTLEFQGWPKTPRFFRDIVITEKIDGTNAAIIVKQVTEEEADTIDAHVSRDADGQWWAVGAQSRKRVIKPGSDNFGFAAWVYSNAFALRRALGEGYHYGEWWGSGIQRGYGLTKGEKRFTLFNVHRYKDVAEQSGGLIDTVPVLYSGPYSEDAVRNALIGLRNGGSHVAPEWGGLPEGVIVFHSASGQVYKALLENDDLPKGAVWSDAA